MVRIALYSIYTALLISTGFVFADDICNSCPLPQAPERNCALIPYIPTEGIIVGLSAYNYGNYDRNGPSDWSNLDCTTGNLARFNGCSYCKNECGGHRQSPVDIKPSVAIQMPIADSPRFILSNSAEVYYGIQPENYKLTCAKGWCGSAKYNGDTYRLLQSHLHCPSEHTINGKHYSLELHLVHVNEDGNLIVLAVLFEEGEENEALDEYLDIADKRCMGSIDLSSLVGMAKQRWTLVSYLGSLTNPPCTESVRFAVSRSVQQASKQQIARFVRQVGGKANNRPTQDLNGRVFFSFNKK